MSWIYQTNFTLVVERVEPQRPAHGSGEGI